MSDPTNLNGQQKQCLLRRLSICEVNQLFPLERRAPCYCYGEELADEDGLMHLAEGFRLSRAVALDHVRSVVSSQRHAERNQIET